MRQLSRVPRASFYSAMRNPEPRFSRSYPRPLDVPIWLGFIGCAVIEPLTQTGGFMFSKTKVLAACAAVAIGLSRRGTHVLLLGLGLATSPGWLRLLRRESAGSAQGLLLGGRIHRMGCIRRQQLRLQSNLIRSSRQTAGPRSSRPPPSGRSPSDAQAITILVSGRNCARGAWVRHRRPKCGMGIPPECMIFSETGGHFSGSCFNPLRLLLFRTKRDDLCLAHQTLCLNQLWPQRPQLGEPRRWINCSQSQLVQ
jgi:hypothetical protein